MENYEKNIVDPKYVYEKLAAENFKVIDCTVYFERKHLLYRILFQSSNRRNSLFPYSERVTTRLQFVTVKTILFCPEGDG